MTTIAEFLEEVEMEGLEEILANGAYIDYESILDPADYAILETAAKAMDEANDLVADLEAIGETDTDDEDEKSFDSEPE